jgi:glucosyl-3-phosphoglycerate phosphatase
MAQENLIAYLVRHGTTASNEAGLFRGNVNVPLDAKGENDAKELSKWFEPKKLGFAIASDLDRTRNTAEAILDPKGMTPHLTRDLRAWNVGYLGGQPKKQHKTEVQYYQDNPTEQIPRGESLAQFRARVQPRLTDAFLKGVQGPHPSLIVGHSSIIHEAGNLLHGDHTFVKVKPGGVVGVFHGPKGFRLQEMYKGIGEGQGADHYGS